jgi:hypothetical protein
MNDIFGEEQVRKIVSLIKPPRRQILRNDRLIYKPITGGAYTVKDG